MGSHRSSLQLEADRMRVLLTGATGFIGRSAASELLCGGHEVIGLARSEEPAHALQGSGLRILRGDVTFLRSVFTAIGEVDAHGYMAFDHDFSRYAMNCGADQRLRAFRGARQKHFWATLNAAFRRVKRHVGPPTMPASSSTYRFQAISQNKIAR